MIAQSSGGIQGSGDKGIRFAIEVLGSGRPVHSVVSRFKKSLRVEDIQLRRRVGPGMRETCPTDDWQIRRIVEYEF